MDFSGSHILSIDQFNRSDIEKLFSVADSLEPYSSKIKVTRVLEGAILGSMFFEPSTRTRISFGASFNLLGGNVREITEVSSSSLAKGESLVDTAVRTSKSGYMQRRLINAMDDLKVANDDMASVRNTANRIIQFEYGEDGTDPARSRKGSPFDVDQVLSDALGGGK